MMNNKNANKSEYPPRTQFQPCLYKFVNHCIGIMSDFKKSILNLVFVIVPSSSGPTWLETSKRCSNYYAQ